MNTLAKTIEYFLFITAELTVLFIGISAIVAMVLMYIPQEKLRSWLSKRGLLGNILGAVFGALTRKVQIFTYLSAIRFIMTS